jgi:hypothetical protein
VAAVTETTTIDKLPAINFVKHYLDEVSLVPRWPKDPSASLQHIPKERIRTATSIWLSGHKRAPSDYVTHVTCCVPFFRRDADVADFSAREQIRERRTINPEAG